VIKNEQGRLYDRFRDRVMFPIVSQKGEVIAFGGRVLGAGRAEVSELARNPAVRERAASFRLAAGARGIRDRETVIVVEGYMDVVALAQHGVDNAIATLGTATTPMQVQKLSAPSRPRRVLL
jgi:DNA primase